MNFEDDNGGDDGRSGEDTSVFLRVPREGVGSLCVVVSSLILDDDRMGACTHAVVVVVASHKMECKECM